MPAFIVPANLAFDNYTDLQDAIADWMDRSDLTGSAPSMIALAESRMRRELVPCLSETTATVSCAAGVGALPADFGTLIRVVYGTRTLDNVSPVGGTDIFTEYTEPYGYSVEAGALRLWPAVTQNVTLLYQPTIPFLSAAQISNSVLQSHPDVYFFGAMLFAEGYVANDNRASLFKNLWDEAIESCKRYYTRQKYAGPLVPRIGFVP